MTNKKHIVIAVLATFCLTSALFMIMPIESQEGLTQYEPWYDLNDDGIIDIFDVVDVTSRYEMEGTPINKTALLLELQDTIATLEERISLLENLHGYQYPIPGDLLNGLVGYWKLDEGEGTVAADSSGTHNNGSLEFGPVWADGKYGKALYLDGIDDYVYIQSSDSLAFNQAVSVACWVNVDGSTGDHQVIVAQNYGTASCWGIEFQNNVPIAQFFVWTAAGSRTYAVAHPVPYGAWVHLVGTYDGSALRIYVNGLIAGSSALPGIINVGNKPIQIGCHLEPSDRNMFKGEVDEVLVYNRTLTAEEALALYLYPPP